MYVWNTLSPPIILNHPRFILSYHTIHIFLSDTSSVLFHFSLRCPTLSALPPSIESFAYLRSAQNSFFFSMRRTFWNSANKIVSQSYSQISLLHNGSNAIEVAGRCFLLSLFPFLVMTSSDWEPTYHVAVIEKLMFHSTNCDKSELVLSTSNSSQFPSWSAWIFLYET